MKRLLWFAWRIRLRLAWLLNRRVGVALLWVLLLMVIAAAVNIAGIQIVGSIAGWERWLRAHSVYFLVWRLCLYTATAWGWLRMRKRLLQRDPAPATRQLLLRAELAAVAAIVLLEYSQWLRND